MYELTLDTICPTGEVLSAITLKFREPEDMISFCEDQYFTNAVSVTVRICVDGYEYINVIELVSTFSDDHIGRIRRVVRNFSRGFITLIECEKQLKGIRVSYDEATALRCYFTKIKNATFCPLFD